MAIAAAALSALAFACDGAASGPACAAIEDAYAAAVAQARICDPAAADACGAARPGALRDPCQCLVAVTPAKVAALDDLAAQWRAAGCRSEPAICNRACTKPLPGCVGPPGGPPTCSGP
jgi:hypothetical protein